MNSKLNIAVCVIAYNRTECLNKVLRSLQNAVYNIPVTLIISIDKSNNDSVKKFADGFEWNHGEKVVIQHKINLGLKQHVLTCGGYTKDYDAVVVLEDDITVSPYYLEYVIQCYNKYKDDSRIAGISLYNFPRAYVTLLPFNPVMSDYDVFMMNCAMSWGQVWTKDKWDEFMAWYNENNEDFNLPHLPYNINHWGKKSWLKYHTRYCIETNKYFIYPYQSLSTNNDDQGTHNTSRKTTHIQSQQCCLEKKNWRLPGVEECIVKYDGFFEPKFLSSYLNVPENELCIDFYGNKKGIKKRYRLTREAMPYKILRSYALLNKPYEANVILNEPGDDIFLYDTTKAGTLPKPISKATYFEYHYLNAADMLTATDMLSILLNRFTEKGSSVIRKLKMKLTRI